MYNIPVLDPHVRRQISNEHVSCAVGNGKGNLAVHQNALRRDTTGMKDGHLIRSDINLIAPVGLVNVRDTNSDTTAHGDGSSMGMGVF